MTVTASTSSPEPTCKHLVLDAGPLLSFSPLRNLSQTYYVVSQVISELKDSRAKAHFESLALNAGVRIQVRNPSPASLSHVVAIAKKTGDYSVLSHTDISVVALTYELDLHEKAEAEKIKDVQPEVTVSEVEKITEDLSNAKLEEQSDLEPQHEVLEEEVIEEESPADDELLEEGSSTPPLYEDPSDDDDGEGEWITPANVSIHKSQALNLIPSKGAAKKQVVTGCMTTDFAMQNVLLHMGLNLVGVDGKKIDKVKTWVLRCHACFKLCKDSSKKFCPSCGNPTLIRASVTMTASDTGAPTTQVHLKKNFQYKTRGTIYSIPSPKPGSAKTGSGEGLILREDQNAWMLAQKRSDDKRDREERKMLNGSLARGGEGGALMGSWMDPDWRPTMLSAGPSGKGRKTVGRDMPTVGYGRKNPNERKRKA